jgi:hypothetical protein
MKIATLWQLRRKYEHIQKLNKADALQKVSFSSDSGRAGVVGCRTADLSAVVCLEPFPRTIGAVELAAAVVICTAVIEATSAHTHA